MTFITVQPRFLQRKICTNLEADGIIEILIDKKKFDPVIKILSRQVVPIDEPVSRGGTTTLMLMSGQGSANQLKRVLRLKPNIN